MHEWDGGTTGMQDDAGGTERTGNATNLVVEQ